jgi:iron complex outermembrane receptor protein
MFSSFNLVFSGRIEYNNSKATDLNEKFNNSNDEIDKNQINPSLSLGFLKDLTENLTMGIWLGRAQRSGSITEKYINSFPVGLDPYDMLGNPSLDPEVNNQLDISFSYKNRNTIIDLSAFVSIINNYISSEIDTSLTPTMASSPGVRRFKNIDDALLLGFEFTWNQGLFYGLQHSLNLAFTYGQDKVEDEPLPEIAPLDVRYILKGSYFENKLSPELSFRHVLEQSRVSAIFGEDESPSFSLIDLKINYKYNKMLGATLGVQNLLDETYYEHLSRNVKGTPFALNAPGRNVYFSLVVDLM